MIIKPILLTINQYKMYEKFGLLKSEPFIYVTNRNNDKKNISN